MLLRASSERDEKDYNLSAVTSNSGDAGVAEGQWLRRLTEAAIGGERNTLAAIVAQASSAIGEQQTVDVLTVAAAFNGITRVADATGIPLDANTEATTSNIREAAGINAFAYSAKSARYG